MSVIIYIYPKKPGELAIEQLLPAIRRRIQHMAIAEIELKRNGHPNWQSLKLVHPTEPEAEMLFVVAPKRRDSVSQLEQQFSKAKELATVRIAPLLVWSQYLFPASLPLRRFRDSWSTYNEVLAALADISDAVIDSPEDERLFTPTAFRRKSRKSRS